MKIFNKVSAVFLATALILGLAGLIPVFAATTPTLGKAITYGVLSSTYTNTVPGTTINGDIGFTTPPAVIPAGTHTNYGSGTPYSTAGIDQGIALANLDSQACTSLGAGAVDLNAVIIGANPPGTFPPGCYSSGGAMNITLSTTVTLQGTGTYIFKPNGALNTGADSIIALDGASVCDIFWTPTATTLGANSTFMGTIIDGGAITLDNNVSLTGRALAFGKTVTTAVGDIITVPTCTNPPQNNSSTTGTINVVKVVINDNGGAKTVADFPLFINGTAVTSGVPNTLTADSTYSVYETTDAKYNSEFSGDCDSTGRLFLSQAANKICIITNDDIGQPVATPPVPPLIDVVKVPNPLALPNGPGNVTYTYTLRNIGTVPVTDVTMVGDNCQPITLISGDTNTDAKLDVNETWDYTCSTLLSETHTNIVTATGWANGISATDIASATVVVGLPTVPPLIHVVKKPNVFTLPAPGGAVTYTYTVTNPGTEPLGNVSITDNKCTGLPGRVVGHPGDLNKNDLLENNETWIFTCKTNLTQTTSNTGTAQGSANGITARDFAIATVVVAAAVPKLPNTGFAPTEQNLLWSIVSVGILLLASASIFIVLKKRKV